MAYSSRDDRRSSRSRNSSRDSRSRNRNRNRRNSSRTRNTAPQSTATSRRGTLTRPDTGYTLSSHGVRRDPRNNGLAVLMKPRVLLLIVLLLIVAAALFFGITSCINRNNESATHTTEETKPKNEQDGRVAAGVSATMTSKFTEALDKADLLAQVAANADQYEDERLLDLALAEPSSLEFIAAYPTSDKASFPYGEQATRGEVPLLYNWDSRWGAVTYGDGPLAVTGSGPTTLAMAYMGLTGKTEFSPTEIAQQASKINYAGNDSGSKAELFLKLPESMGLKVTSSDPSSDTLITNLGDNTVIAAEVKADTLTDKAHWVLIVNVDEDYAVTVFDPTSTAVSTRPWVMDTIVNASTGFYAISASDATLKELESSSSTSSTQSDTSSDTAGSASTSSTTPSASSATGSTQRGTDASSNSKKSTGYDEVTDDQTDDSSYADEETDEESEEDSY